MGFDDSKKIFIEEANDLLRKMEHSLLMLENDLTDRELIGEVFRYLHTIKGSGAMFKFDRIVTVAHGVENLYSEIRANKIELTYEIIELSLTAIDCIDRLLNDPGHSEINQNLMTLIDSFLKIQAKPASPSSLDDASVSLAAGIDELCTYQIAFKPDFDISRRAVKLNGVLKELQDISEPGSYECTLHTGNIPAFEDINPEKMYIDWDIQLKSRSGIQGVQNAFIFINDIASIDIQQKNEPDNLEGKSPAEGIDNIDRDYKRKSFSVRVHKDKLDSLMDAVGELVILQARMMQSSKKMRNLHFLDLSEELLRLTMNLRDITMNIRMVPLAETFSSFHRLIRDLSKKLSKDIRLDIHGESTELDKNIIESLKDPIVHLVRNSADHGIEMPDVRESNGKDRAGTIRIAAEQVGSKICIEVSDDGAGLNLEKIKAKAVSLGLLDSSENDPQTIYNQIFEPGFSTTDAATDLSGRGVGMDVIKNSIEKLRGEIIIDSNPGQGTVIQLLIPLTLVIVDALLFKVNGIKYVIPMGIIKEIVDPKIIQIRKGDDTDAKHDIIQLRDGTIPVIDLYECFTFGKNKKDLDTEMLVIINSDGLDFAFKVDEIIKKQQVVIKPFSTTLNNMPIVSGGSILGDGTVAYILNISELIKQNAHLKNAKRRLVFQGSSSRRDINRQGESI